MCSSDACSAAYNGSVVYSFMFLLLTEPTDFTKCSSLSRIPFLIVVEERVRNGRLALCVTYQVDGNYFMIEMTI